MRGLFFDPGDVRYAQSHYSSREFKDLSQAYPGMLHQSLWIRCVARVLQRLYTMVLHAMSTHSRSPCYSRRDDLGECVQGKESRG